MPRLFVLPINDINDSQLIGFCFSYECTLLVFGFSFK